MVGVALRGDPAGMLQHGHQRREAARARLVTLGWQCDYVGLPAASLGASDIEGPYRNHLPETRKANHRYHLSGR